MKENRKPYSLQQSPTAASEAMVQGEKYRFTILTGRLIRMEYQEEGSFTDEPTQTVICRKFDVPEFRVMEDDTHLEIVTEYLHVYYDKKAFSGAGLSVQLHRGYAVYGSVWHYGDELHDLKGTARTLDNVDGAIELETGLLSRDGFSVLDDSHAALLSEDGWVRGREKENCDLYFFGYGHDYLDCLRDFYHLTGATPLLPRFALGNWWSRFYPYTEESYLTLMKKFREQAIPLAVAVLDMDWHLTNIPEKYGSGWTGYTWNREFFPDPERFLGKLHEMGMHVTLNVHPADGVRAHEEEYLPMAKALGISYEKEDKIPFDVTNREFMEAYFKYLHHPREQEGVDFWWIDWQQGERSGVAGVDTLWMLNHLHFLDSGRDGKIPLTFSRYAGIGSHRYPIGFSGDTVSSWKSLDFQPFFTANASNVGYTWWSHDIGGHQKGCKDDEMVVRWIQFGVFSPIMRLHSTANEFYGKEPWNYNPIAERIITEYLQLRHKLIPYLYTMNYRTHARGIPLIQPMYYRHDVQEAYEVPNEYYFGDSMIVCPVTQKLDHRMLLAEFEAWIPEGIYYDFFNGQIYRGGRRLVLYRDLESIPVLVPAGSIIPLTSQIEKSHLENPGQLDIQVYNGADGSFDLYEDDGTGEDGKHAITHLTYNIADKTRFSVEPEGDAKEVLPATRRFCIHFKGVYPLKKATIIGEGTGKKTEATVESVHYNEEQKEATVVLTARGTDCFVLELEWQDTMIVSPDKCQRIYGILQRAQIEYELKEKIYRTICADHNISRLLADLYAMQLEPKLYGAVLEGLSSDI